MNAVDELNLLLGIGPARPRLPITLQKSGYAPIKLLGKGSFGQAYLIFHKERDMYFVAKHVNMTTMSQKQRREAHNEIQILQQMNHSNIVRYIEFCEEHPNLYIVMEYADGGDLYSYMKRVKATGKELTEEQILNLFVQVTLAIKFMHDQRILHRDIKAQNVFLTKAHVVKLGDFGISTVLQSTVSMAKTVCGTPCYFSPELCAGKPYNNKSDVWALGVLLYEMAANRLPFESANMKRLMEEIVHLRPSRIPGRYSDGLWSLTQAMLEKDPARRPDAAHVLRHPVILDALPRITHLLADAAVAIPVSSPRKFPVAAAAYQRTPTKQQALSVGPAVPPRRAHQQIPQPPQIPQEQQHKPVSQQPQQKQESPSAAVPSPPTPPPRCVGGAMPAQPQVSSSVSRSSVKQRDGSPSQKHGGFAEGVSPGHEAVMLAGRESASASSASDHPVYTQQQQQDPHAQPVPAVPGREHFGDTQQDAAYRPALLQMGTMSTVMTEYDDYGGGDDDEMLVRTELDAVIHSMNTIARQPPSPMRSRQHAALPQSSAADVRSDADLVNVNSASSVHDQGTATAGEQQTIETASDLQQPESHRASHHVHDDGSSDGRPQQPYDNAGAPSSSVVEDDIVEEFIDGFGATLDIPEMERADRARRRELKQQQQQPNGDSNSNVVTDASLDPTSSSVDEDDVALSGGCLCGATVYAGWLSYIFGSFRCSCEVCRRFSGSTQGMEWLHLPAVVFPEVVSEARTLNMFTVSGDYSCYFCNACGSSMAVDRHQGMEGCCISKASLSDHSLGVLMQFHEASDKPEPS